MQATFVPTILAALRLARVELGEGATTDSEPGGKVRQKIQGTVADLLAAGLVSAGTVLTFERAGKKAEAAITADGQLVVNGKAYGTPSTAAAAALGLKAANGWVSWRLNAGTGPTLAELRSQLPGPAGSDVEVIE